MATQVLVPELGESVVEATVGEWMVKVGDSVSVGDVLVELQTDKVDLEVTADVAGILAKIEREADEDVEIGDVLGVIEAGEGGGSAPAPVVEAAPEAKAPATAAPALAAQPVHVESSATPVARRVASAENVDISSVTGSGKGGKVTKADVVAAQAPAPSAPAPVAPPAAPVAAPQSLGPLTDLLGVAERQERVKMSRRRRTIAKNLVQAQQTAAMLTTFNEIDMHNVMALRSRRKAWFEEKFGTRLGFMSFFVKAAVASLKQFPRINAEIDGDTMVLKNHYDIGIAVGAKEGLVVPVVRDADKLSFADIEKTIRGYGKAARDNTLSIADMMGGTFTITNGGVFGSMLSTPILNAPQVGILGMHNIVKRPMVVDDEIVIRPIMYVALSYDHRIVDGSEAVRFLYRIKELIEDPEDLLLAG